jgi:hypothetical protein
VDIGIGVLGTEDYDARKKLDRERMDAGGTVGIHERTKGVEIIL